MPLVAPLWRTSVAKVIVGRVSIEALASARPPNPIGQRETAAGDSPEPKPIGHCAFAIRRALDGTTAELPKLYVAPSSSS